MYCPRTSCPTTTNSFPYPSLALGSAARIPSGPTSPRAHVRRVSWCSGRTVSIAFSATSAPHSAEGTPPYVSPRS